MRDIASAARVSPGTVSRALKNEPGLTEATRQQVLDAARALGYDFGKLRPKRLRRLAFLLRRQHHTVSSSPFFTQVLHGAEQACRQRGIILSFMTASLADGLIEQLRLHAPDGLICAGFFEPELLAALRATGKPLVLIDMRLRGYSSVNPDNMTGGLLATRHLLDIGRTRAGMISGPLSHYSIRERVRGYRQALFEAGIPADPALEANLPDGVDLEAGVWEAMESLLALPQPPDGVFCYNDSAALVAMRCCQAKGIKIPHDIAIAGFDDMDTATTGQRPLTTLRVDKQALGAMGVELLLNASQQDPLERISPVTLVVRDSTVPASSRAQSRHAVKA